jgi:NADH dehydrogenase [ubiquinone] 1 alpha subcomplex assembly factor 3
MMTVSGCADDAEILLFGTGQTVIPAPKEIRDYISSLGIQLDVMDSVSRDSRYAE